MISPRNPFIFGVKRSKGQGHNACIGLRIEHNITAAAYASHAGFSLLQCGCPAAQAMLASHTRLSLRHVPAFACRWIFPGVFFCNMSAGFFYLPLQHGWRG